VCIVPAEDEQPLFNHVVEQLDALGIVYLHVVEGATGGPRDAKPFDYAALRQRFGRTFLANNGFDRALAEQELAAGNADLFAFGRAFIANPDLVERLKTGAPLNPLDPTTLYGGGAKGYTDYPALADTVDA
jgi:N-ethylmaleimide reductase